MIHKAEVYENGSKFTIIKLTCDGCGKDEYLAEDPYCQTAFEKNSKGEDNCPKCVQAALAKLWQLYHEEEG